MKLSYATIVYKTIYKEKYDSVMKELTSYIEKSIIADCFYYTPTYKDLFNIVLEHMMSAMTKCYLGQNAWSGRDPTNSGNPVKMFFYNYNQYKNGELFYKKYEDEEDHCIFKKYKNLEKNKRNIVYGNEVIHYEYSGNNTKKEHIAIYHNILNDNKEYLFDKQQMVQFSGNIFHYIVFKLVKTYNGDEVLYDSSNKYCLRVAYDYCLLTKPKNEFSYWSTNKAYYRFFPDEMIYYQILKKWRDAKRKTVGCSDNHVYEYSNRCDKYEDKLKKKMNQFLKEQYFKELKSIKQSIFSKNTKFPDVMNDTILSFV